MKCDGTCAETRSCLSAKQMSPFKLMGASVQSTTGSRGVHINGSNAGYIMFCSSVKGTSYPLHPPVSPSLPLPCGTMCHHISTGVYSSGRVIGLPQRPLLDNTQQTFIHSPLHLSATLWKFKMFGE